jgi:hypothetical protein
VIGRSIGVQIKNCKKKSNSTGKKTIPVRFCTYVKVEVLAVIGKLLRFSTGMHWLETDIIMSGSLARYAKTI